MGRVAEAVHKLVFGFGGAHVATSYSSWTHVCFGPAYSAGASYSRAASTTAGTAIAAVLAAHAARSGMSAGAGTLLSRAALFTFQFRTLLFGSVLVAAVARWYDESISLVKSFPRTLRTFVWALRAGAAYKQFHAAAFLNGLSPQDFQEALNALHTHWAQKLLDVCRANGGVYIKAGQFASAFGAVPREYRTILAQLEDRAVPRPYAEVGGLPLPICLLDMPGFALHTLLRVQTNTPPQHADLATIHAC